MTDSYFFIQPFQITQDVPSRFGLIEIKADDETSLLKIPLEFVSPQLQDSIRTGEGGEGGAARISLEEYVQTFKLGNIKHKKRVFTAMKDAKEPALMPEEE